MKSQMTLVAERTAVVRPAVLIMPGWPGGFCPIHYGTDVECWSMCWSTRIWFAEAARELAEYFSHTRWR